MMERLQKLLITRTFAFAWLGFIFASQAGSYVGNGGSLGGFIFHFFSIALAGYIVGFAVGNHMYSGILHDVVTANNEMAAVLQGIFDKLEAENDEPPVLDGTANIEEERDV